MKLLQSIPVFLLVCLIGISGCSKKLQKSSVLPESKQPAAEAPAAPETQQTPAYTPSDSDTFTPIDMDALTKKALTTIYFDFNQYSLRPDAIGKLETIANFLRANPKIRLLSEGHCDERGSSEYNMGLGEKRAVAVKQYLISYGIAQNRLESTSYGKEQPARQGCGDDDACHGENRRTEWKVLAK